MEGESRKYGQIITFRITKEEREKLLKKARDKNITISDYIRGKVFKGKRDE